MTNKRAHDKSLNEIINNPSIIGIGNYDIEVIMKEPVILQYGTLVACPDLVFICEDNQNYVVEYKHTFNEKGYEQLSRADSVLRHTSIKGSFDMIFAYRDKKERMIYERC